MLWIFHSGGESRINRFRDEARAVSIELGMTAEFEKLNRIISALLATHSSNQLSTASGKALAAGIPYDMYRAELRYRYDYSKTGR
jgi:hypothetical protein